jgi:hypothetical protein
VTAAVSGGLHLRLCTESVRLRLILLSYAATIWLIARREKNVKSPVLGSATLHVRSDTARAGRSSDTQVRIGRQPLRDAKVSIALPGGGCADLGRLDVSVRDEAGGRAMGRGARFVAMGAAVHR